MVEENRAEANFEPVERLAEREETINMGTELPR